MTEELILTDNELIYILKSENDLFNLFNEFSKDIPPITVWNISESEKPKFWQRLKLALKFLFKNDKAYFEQYCSEHKAEIKKLNEEK